MLLAWMHLALVGAMFDPGPVDPAALDLRWRAPADCPDEDAVRRDVAALLGNGRPDAASFDAAIEPRDDQLELRLSTRWSDGREDARTIAAGSCTELTDAAVLLIAISLDPIATVEGVRDHGWDRASVRTRATDPAPAPAPERAPPTEPAPRPAPPEVVPAPPSPALVFGIRPELTLDWGSLPRLAPGPSLNLSVTWKLLRAEVTGVYLPPQRATRSDLLKQGAWVELGAAAPRVCITPTADNVSFPVCAGLELGATRARALGSELSTPPVQFWAAATGGPTLIWAFIPRLALAIGLDIVVPITRPQVVTASLDTLHSPESVVLRPRLGLELRL